MKKRILLFLLILMLSAETVGSAAAEEIGYEAFFDPSFVHSIDILLPEWDAFLIDAAREEYVSCAVTIDGEQVSNVGLRAKGNGSLLAVSRMGSSRYSWKIEFDHYEKKRFFHGLDKLCLNNFMEDATFMKETVVYTAMAAMDVPAPLCAYAFVTVNGQDLGLYQMVEAIEDGFLARNFGGAKGKLYKPDDINVSDFALMENQNPLQGMLQLLQHVDLSALFKTDWSQLGQLAKGDVSQMYGDGSSFIGSENNPLSALFSNLLTTADDLLLKYVDDNPESYPNIFGKAKSKIKEKDQKRLIASIKRLNEGADLEKCVQKDEVIRYFAVHNLFVNSDSYTGMSTHNYYLWELDGVLLMLPWDYNLAFGTMLMKPSYAVNDPIDEPMAVKSDGNHPMFEWIIRDPEAKEQYDRALLDAMNGIDYEALIQRTDEMIAPYVERDPTKFVSLEDYQAGVGMLKTYLARRMESVQGQISGSIPATKAGQAQNPEALVPSSDIDLHLLGDVTMGFFDSSVQFNPLKGK